MAKIIKRVGIIFFVLVISCLVIMGCVVATNTANNNGFEKGENQSAMVDSSSKETPVFQELSGATCAAMATNWDTIIQNAKKGNNKVYVKLMDNWTAAITTDGVQTSFGSSDVSFYRNDILIPEGMDVTIDLNGKTIDRGLSTQRSNGSVIFVEGTLRLIDSGFDSKTIYDLTGIYNESTIHDITSGSVKLNGIETSEYELSALRDRFAYVFQDVFLFSNTIDSNIAYSEPDIEHEQIISAARHAQAHSFIQSLPDSYDTIVGERGLGISGGQKQRISIARALLKDAPVLVLDDSTSALDVQTEKKLLADIKENYPDKTVLISAHRLSSVVSCDEILYMQDGMITERGTFDELMALNGRFAKVYKVQEAQNKEIINYKEETDTFVPGTGGY